MGKHHEMSHSDQLETGRIQCENFRFSKVYVPKTALRGIKAGEAAPSKRQQHVPQGEKKMYKEKVGDKVSPDRAQAPP